MPASPDASPLRAQIPNTLTILRLILAIALFVLLALGLSPEGLQAADPATVLFSAAALFIIAAITDALDGALARRWNVISRFGRIMDPFADKLLVLGTFVFLAGPAFRSTGPDAQSFQASGVLPWMVIVILARELLVTTLRAFLEGEGHDFSAGWAGKLKMILQSVVIPFILLALAIWPTPGETLRLVIDVAVWLTVVATALSCISYIQRAATTTRENP